MTFQEMKPLPLGTSSFSTLRENNEIYVDKTSMIYEMARSRGKYFITRPRRFGKSLLVSTFESLFKYGLRDFNGLAIENLWNDKTYTVLRLDFSLVKDFNTIDEFLYRFNVMLDEVVIQTGIELMAKNDDPIARFSAFLSQCANNSIVLLIDEYDAPLTALLHQKNLFDQVRVILSQFYAGIKSYERCLRFFFMTGITKFSNTSIFSAFNNLTDISLVPAYGTLLGITEDELNHYFGRYIEKAANQLNLSQSEVVEKLRLNYDGFSFDNKAKTHVYCPWSILQFFNQPDNGFQNYWYQSGGQPTVLLQYLAQHALVTPAHYNESIVIPISDLDASRHYNEINIDVLLTQSGYLTAKEIIGEGYVRLGYPNQEVASSMARLYADELLRNQNRMVLGIPLLPVMMANESVDLVIDHFNKVFNAIDFNRYPIVDEASCRAFLQVLLIGAAMMPRVETHTAHGRSDLEVDAGQRHWVFEFKYAKNVHEADALLAEAIEQVKTRQYGEVPQTNELVRVALVFGKEERQVVKWSTI